MNFEKCIYLHNHYHNKNVEHFHYPPNSHMSACSHTPTTTTTIGMRQPLSAFYHSRFVLPFQEFHINGIICCILSSHKINGKARATPSSWMGVTDMNLLGELALAPRCLETATLLSQHGTLPIACSCSGDLFLWLSIFTTTSLLSFLSCVYLLGPHLPIGKVNNK